VPEKTIDDSRPEAGDRDKGSAWTGAPDTAVAPVERAGIPCYDGVAADRGGRSASVPEDIPDESQPEDGVRNEDSAGINAPVPKDILWLTLFENRKEFLENRKELVENMKRFEASLSGLASKEALANLQLNLSEAKQHLKDDIRYTETTIRKDTILLEKSISSLDKKLDGLKADLLKNHDDFKADLLKNHDGFKADTGKVFGDIDKRFYALDKKIDDFKADTGKRFGDIDTKIDDFRADTGKRFGDIDKRFDALGKTIDDIKKSNGWIHRLLVALIVAIIVRSFF
jgi:hypothetical protein